MKILIATHNPGKFQEIKEIFADTDLKLLSLKDLKITDNPHEHGKNYKENAIIKANYFHNLSGLPVMADDSGIEVDALKGELGVKTRRWGKGHKASDQEWLDHFLETLKKHPTPRERKARFHCCAIYLDQKNHHIANGFTEGVLTLSPQAEIIPGIPLSACFLPDGYKKVFSALSTKEKNQVSHRGKAFEQLKKWLLKKALKIL